MNAEKAIEAIGLLTRAISYSELPFTTEEYTTMIDFLEDNLKKCINKLDLTWVLSDLKGDLH